MVQLHRLAIVAMGLVLVTAAVPAVISAPGKAQMADLEDCTPHSRIRIVGDAMLDLGPAVGVVNPGAQGTAEDPYRIEGWCITPTVPGVVEQRSGGAVQDTAIVIEDTSAHIVVRDNEITPHRPVVDPTVEVAVDEAEDIYELAFLENPEADQDVALRIENAANVRVQDNLVDNNPPTSTVGTTAHTHTVGVIGSQSVEIVDNDVTDNGYNGVGVVSSSDVTVAANRIAGNGLNGVYVTGSSQVTLSGNDVVSNGGNQVYGSGHYGLQVLGGEPVDASDNWWGSADGPSGGVNDACTEAVADGSGQVIRTANVDGPNGKVCFDPWSTSPNLQS